MRTAAILLALLVALPALSQAEEDASRPLNDSEPGSMLARALSQLTLISVQEETAFRAEIGHERERANAIWATSLRLQAPVKKGQKERELANLSGLSNGTVASLQMTRVSYGRDYSPGNIIEVCQEYNDTIPRPGRVDIAAGRCTRDSIRSLLDAWNAPKKAKAAAEQAFDDAVISALQTTCVDLNKAGLSQMVFPVEMECTDSAAVTELMKSIDASNSRCVRGPDGKPSDACWERQLEVNTEKALKPFCQSLNADPAMWGHIRIHGDEGQCTSETLDALEGDWGRKAIEAAGFAPTYLGMQVSLANQPFSFIEEENLPTLQETSTTRQGLGFGVTAGRLIHEGSTYVGLGGRVERAYKGADAIQLCAPLEEGGSVLRCKTVATQPPTHSDKEIVHLELRRYIGDRYAITPRISHDFNSGVTGYELITYILSSASGQLNGGITLGYRDDEDKPSAGLFIGTAFDLFRD